jgi:cyclopropane fatty-acyl-phospholipid synthase-like methyltransferase
MQARWEQAHASRAHARYPHEKVVRWAFRHLAPGMRVLDLGCGTGRHALFLAREGFRADACDVSRPGLEALRQAAAAQGLDVPTLHATAADLGAYGDATFDAVVCFGVLYYMALDEAARAIAEVRRVLKPGGLFLCVTRTTEDGRRAHATPLGPHAWRIDALAPGAPSTFELGMPMLFLEAAALEGLFAGLVLEAVDHMTYVHQGFADDDWVITARKEAPPCT